MEEILEELGFSKSEAIVYLKLSEIGLSSAYKIAKEAKLFKANTYDILKKLVQKGAISQITVENKVMYEAVDPTFFIDFLEAKKEKINQILPSIRIMQNFAKTESVFNVYKGVDSYIRILYHFLEFKDSIRIYGASLKAYNLLKHRINHFHQERIKRRIRQVHIYNYDALDRIRKIRNMPYTPIKCLPELFDAEVTTNVCGNEVVFVIWDPPVKVLQIKDKDMAEAYKKYFKILWKNAKKIV